jgi:protein-tyrosine phosphatase
MTDATEPLRIDAIAVPGGGELGLLHCPGRCGGVYGSRRLADDLASIEAWGASVLVSLNEPQEFARLGVPTFMTDVKTCNFRWLHAPIHDMDTPGAAFEAAWAEAGLVISAALDRRERIAIHCAAGLGRTGLLAARVLVDRGLGAEEAIARVRRARPGTIETARQAAFVRAGPRLL